MARNKYPEVTVQRILDTSYRLFLEKGYEQTTIQDIVDALGDLSKGAIYHHFKSKEEIIEAVVAANNPSESELNALFEQFDALPLNGLEKIRKLASFCVSNPEQKKFLTAISSYLKNPKFLAESVRESVEITAPRLAPFIEEGIRDGSIQSDHPRQLAEVLLLLLNVWLNPLVFSDSEEIFEQKFAFLKDMTDAIGVPVLNEELKEQLKSFVNLRNYNQET